jgi:hypothetical protein
MQKIVLAAVAALALLPVAASAGEVQNRINDEHARIDQGVANHSLSYGQFRRLDNRLDHIEAQRDRDLRANGGRLTSGEDRQLNREENNLSDRIYWDKHT